MPYIDEINQGGNTVDIYAKALSTPRNINGMAFNGTSNITDFAVCSTAAATAAKTATITGYSLSAGSQVVIKFTYGNTAASPTLEIGNTGAKSIVNAGWKDGDVVSFVYDGTNYVGIGTATDTTLSINGGLADAKATGDAINYTHVRVGCPNVWELGSIFATDGTNMSSNIRIRTKDYIDVNIAAETYGISGTFKYFAYDTAYNYLGTNDNWVKTITKSEIITDYPTTRWVRYLWKINDTQVLTLTDIDTYLVQIIQDDSLTEVEENVYPISVLWEVGTLASVTGLPQQSSTRLRTKEYLPISAIEKVSVASGGTLGAFTYRELNDEKTASTGWMVAYGGMTRDDLLTMDSEAVYCKFMWRKLNDAAVSVADASNIKIVTKPVTYDYTTEQTYPYYGEKINADNRYTLEPFGYFGDNNSQAGCVYNNKLVRFGKNKTFAIYDLQTKTSVGSGTLGGSVTPHCNTACFSNTFYDAGDEFPLVYINAYNATGLPKGTCYVHRITGSGSSYTTTLIQTITIGFTTDPIWTDGHDVRPYGNFCVDAINNLLYVYTLQDAAQQTKFFKFVLPSTSSDVMLTTADILDSWTCPYFPVIQDNACHNGLLYLCTGGGGGGVHGMIRVVDPVSKREITTVDLYANGWTYEPEVIDVYNRAILCGYALVYRFVF